MIDDVVFKLRPSDYVDQTDDGCSDRFSSIDEPNTVYLGLPFLRAFYTVFDRDALKVGIALSNHKTENVELSPLSNLKRLVIEL